MKKIVCLAFLTIFLSTFLYAQDDVKIKGTYNGSPITVIAVRSPKGGDDVIRKVSYPKLDMLEREVENLKRQKKDLEKQKNQLAAENEKLKKSKPTKADNSKAVTDSLQQVTKRLALKEEQANAMRAEVERLKKELQNMQEINEENVAAMQSRIDNLELKVKRKGKNTDFVSLGMELGTSRFNNQIIKRDKDNWSQPLNIQLQRTEATYTHYFQHDMPIAIRTGLGISLLGTHVSYHGTGETIENQYDIDSLRYNADYYYKDISEDVELRYLDVPLMVHIGNSFNTQGIQAWCDLGIQVSFKIGERYNPSGTYTVRGFYPEWNATLQNIEVLGFNENVQLSEKKIPTGTSPIVVWGVVAAGVRIPINESISIGVGARCSYPITPAAETTKGHSETRKLLIPEHSSLLAEKMRILTAGLDFSISYNF